MGEKSRLRGLRPLRRWTARRRRADARYRWC